MGLLCVREILCAGFSWCKEKRCGFKFVSERQMLLQASSRVETCVYNTPTLLRSP